jgi:PAS domain-containing protein
MKIPRGDINLVTPTPNQHRHSYISANHLNSAALLSVVVGSLMLDSKGTILTCTVALARLCGVDEEEIIGRHIKSLLPAVPLSPNTEGYNIAFVAYSSASGRTGSWSLFAANGDTVQVEGSFTLLKAETKYLFRLQLNWTEDAGVAPERKYQLRRRPLPTATVSAGWRRKKVTRTI